MVPSSSERDLRETVGRVSAGSDELYSEFFWTVGGHASIDADVSTELNLSRDPAPLPLWSSSQPLLHIPPPSGPPHGTVSSSGSSLTRRGWTRWPTFFLRPRLTWSFSRRFRLVTLVRAMNSGSPLNESRFFHLLGWETGSGHYLTA